MKTGPVTLDDLRGVFVVPPLARRPDAARSLHIDQNDVLVRHMLAGGLTRLLYGGNAFLYHVSRDEFATLIGWWVGSPGAAWGRRGVVAPVGRGLEQSGGSSLSCWRSRMRWPGGVPFDRLGS